MCTFCFHTKSENTLSLCFPCMLCAYAFTLSHLPPLQSVLMTSSTRLECVRKTSQIWQPTSAWRLPGLGGDGAAAAARCHSPPLSWSLVPHSAAGSSPLFDASVQRVKTGSISMHERLPLRLRVRVFGLGTWKAKWDKCTGNINTHFWGSGCCLFCITVKMQVKQTQCTIMSDRCW